MYTPGPNEKTSTVMFYSQSAFVRGDLVAKENVRVSIWLRTQGVPNYLHMLKAQILLFGGTPPKSIAYNELYFPVSQIIAFHLAPPLSEPLDYDAANEPNLTNTDINLLLGSFTVKAKARISTRSDFATSIEVSRSAWLSVYEADITNVFLPQIPSIHVPMMLVRPDQVSFGS